MVENESDYIYGIHDRGGAHVLDGKGWVVQTEELGCDPEDWGSASYADLPDQGLGVIVRLNHGYGPHNGTIPVVEHYAAFAKRCGNFVERSEGCRIWIIGNEPNLGCERPQWQPIRATMYANCYRLCRREIRNRPGHEDDQVLIAAVGPWNVETGPWLDYFTDVLWELNINSVHGFQLDGIALHTYSRGSDPASITAETMMDYPFAHLHSGFQTYRDWMEAIPDWALNLPVYITEADQDEAWIDQDTGWVQEAYAEIDRWNRGQGHQQIRCLVLYRWEKYDKYHLEGRDQVLRDLAAAIGKGYRWGAPPMPDMKLTEMEIARGRQMWEKLPISMKHAFELDSDGQRVWDYVDETTSFAGFVVYTLRNRKTGRLHVFKRENQAWKIVDEQIL